MFTTHLNLTQPTIPFVPYPIHIHCNKSFADYVVPDLKISKLRLLTRYQSRLASIQHLAFIFATFSPLTLPLFLFLLISFLFG